jgi:hypothetical protein
MLRQYCTNLGQFVALVLMLLFAVTLCGDKCWAAEKSYAYLLHCIGPETVKGDVKGHPYLTIEGDRLDNDYRESGRMQIRPERAATKPYEKQTTLEFGFLDPDGKVDALFVGFVLVKGGEYKEGQLSSCADSKKIPLPPSGSEIIVEYDVAQHVQHESYSSLIIPYKPLIIHVIVLTIKSNKELNHVDVKTSSPILRLRADLERDAVQQLASLVGLSTGVLPT